MAAVYGFKRFNYPEAMRVNLEQAPDDTNAVGATGNLYYDSVNKLGKSDVGSILEVGIDSVTNKLGATVLADKAAVDLTKSNYLLAEVPSATDATDFYFVGIPLKTKYDVDNLVLTTVQHDWAKQFYGLRTKGVR